MPRIVPAIIDSHGNPGTGGKAKGVTELTSEVVAGVFSVQVVIMLVMMVTTTTTVPTVADEPVVKTIVELVMLMAVADVELFDVETKLLVVGLSVVVLSTGGGSIV